MSFFFKLRYAWIITPFDNLEICILFYVNSEKWKMFTCLLYLRGNSLELPKKSVLPLSHIDKLLQYAPQHTADTFIRNNRPMGSSFALLLCVHPLSVFLILLPSVSLPLPCSLEIVNLLKSGFSINLPLYTLIWLELAHFTGR